MSIPVGASGAQAELPFRCMDGDGNPVLGLGTFAAHTVERKLPGGTFAAATKANIVEWGRGRYALRLTAGESATAGQAAIYVAAAAGQFNTYWGDEDIVASPRVIADTLLDTALDTGRTPRGFLRRMYALFFGKVTGMNVTGTVTAFKSDNVTPEFTVAQDLEAGTRNSAGAE